jgi:hypothetical protein
LSHSAGFSLLKARAFGTSIQRGGPKGSIPRRDHGERLMAGFQTLDEAINAAFPPKHVRVVASRVDGEDAYVLFDTRPAVFFVMTIVYALPVVIVLVLTRRWTNRTVRIIVGALACAGGTSYTIYGFDQYDVWRFGMPLIAYLAIAYLLPVLVSGVIAAWMGWVIWPRSSRFHPVSVARA